MIRITILISIVNLLFLVGCEEKTKKKVTNPPVQKTDSTAYFDSLYAPYAHRIDSFFSKERKKTQFYGNVLFADKGNIVFAKSYGFRKRKYHPEITLDHTFQIASASKPITAIATLMLVDQGKINLTDTLQKFFPKFPYKNITVHQLLCHRSGMPRYDYFCDNPDTIWTDKDCSINNDEVLEIIYRLKPNVTASPNRKFYYSNTNYVLLASIIEKVSSISYEQFLQENIFTPLEMNSTRIYKRDNLFEMIKPVIGYEYNFREALNIYLNGCVGDKGIYTNVRDLLKFDQALYTEKLLSKELLEKAFSGYSRGNKYQNYKNYGYGFRMIDHSKKGKIIYHNGWWRGFRSYFIRIVEKQQTIIILTNVKRGPLHKINDLVKYLP